MPDLNAAVFEAERIAADPRHGYSQPNRDGIDYDCSSLVCRCLRNAGFAMPSYNFSTRSMGQWLQNARVELARGASWRAARRRALEDGAHRVRHVAHGVRRGAHERDARHPRGGAGTRRGGRSEPPLSDTRHGRGLLGVSTSPQRRRTKRQRRRCSVSPSLPRRRYGSTPAGARRTTACGAPRRS